MELRMRFEFRARAFDPKLDIQEIDCAICLDPLDSPDGKKIVPLHCKHVFHLDCLNEWVKKKK